MGRAREGELYSPRVEVRGTAGEEAISWSEVSAHGTFGVDGLIPSQVGHEKMTIPEVRPNS